MGIRSEKQKILVVQVHYNTPLLQIESLVSLESERAGYADFEVLVVDNCSPDGSANYLQEEIEKRGWSEWVSLLRSDVNGGYAYANNLAVAHHSKKNKSADVLWLLNPDTVVQNGALKQGLFELSKASKLIVGSRLTDLDGQFQNSKFHFPSILGEISSGFRLGVLDQLIAKYRNRYSSGNYWLAGASLFMNLQTYHELNGMDDNYFLYFEEVDFLNRAVTAGYRCQVAKDSYVVHFVGGSTGISDFRGTQPRRPKYWFDSRNRYFLKNHGVLYLALCDAFWIFGYITWFTRKSIIRSRQIKNEPKYYLYDFLRYGIFNPMNWRSLIFIR
jgi:N-acetylglucosaminyl-diphospho-decaprenol L-rhamnosyltransferase